MLKLYQFPISHYCEKIRWVLDYKRLSYEVVNLLVGRHREATLAIAPKSAVPVLEHDGVVIQNSSDIVTYLEQRFPQPSLRAAGEVSERIEWERYIDDVLGVELRCFWYHHLLQSAEAVVPLFTVDCGPEGPGFYQQAFPTLQQRMRDFMTINAATAVLAKQRLQEGIDRLYALHQRQPFIMGNTFSRVDITAAAILSPAALDNERIGLSGTPLMPAPLREFLAENREKTAWIRELYRSHRQPA